MFDHASGDLDQALADGRELGTGQRVCRRDRSAHPMHQPVRGSVEYEPDLIGGRGMTRHAVRRQSSFVQLDQVLHLPALAVDVLVKVLRRAFERGDDVADVDLVAHAGLSSFARRTIESVNAPPAEEPKTAMFFGSAIFSAALQTVIASSSAAG